nr:PREDICTED: microtubule-associated protein futsch-like [Daucus carota subsp. sativus]
MSTKAFEFDGAKFVTNNYAAVLTNDEAPSEFHLIQDYLAHSELMYALTQPEVISPAQVLTLWRSARYNDGGEQGSPSLTCTYEGQEYLVTPETVRKALHLPEHSKYHSSVSTQTLKDMMHQQIGYSLIHNLSFDIAPSILRYIGDRKLEDENTVYFARFCQLIFSYCYPLVPIPDTDTELPFKITKRAFTDLMKKDSKKPQLPVFAIPVTVQDKLKQAMPEKYGSLFSDENVPSSSHQQQTDAPTSGPSNKEPVAKSDKQQISDPSQKGPVIPSSPTRVLRSSKSPSKSSPPPRKRRFLQKISDSDSDTETVPVPLVSRPRKKIKPTSTITDLTVDPPQESMVNPLEMVTVSDPLMVEPLSAVPLTTSSEHTPEADIPMSEDNLQSEEPLPQPTAAVIPSSAQTPEAHTPEAHSPEAHNPEAIVSTPEAIVTTPDIAQETLIPVEDFVTSVPPVDSATHIAEVFAQIRESISVREVSPVRVSSPIKPASPAPDCNIPHSKPTETRVCTLSYSRRMHRAPPSSVEARLSSIESTQRSMQQTLADLSSSVAQLSETKENRSDKVGSSSKQTQTTKSQTQTTTQPLIPADSKSRALSEQLIELGNPESKILSHTVKIQGEETTLFYKAPTQLDFDEAVAKNIFEEENPGVSIEDIRKEEERPRVYQKKSDSDSSGKGKNIIDGAPSKKKDESEVKQTLATIPESIDQNLASDTAQAKNMKEDQLKPAEVKATWIKSTSDKAQNEATKRWSERLKRTIQEKRRFYGISSEAKYVPKITQEDGSEIDMIKNSSVLETIAGTRILGYNNEADRPGAIQLGEAMKRCKIEEDLITQFVKESYGYRLIG